MVETFLPGAKPAEGLFVGRSKEVKRLCAALSADEESGAVVVSAVAGMGGLGKTTLARHVAIHAVNKGLFTGGAVFADLRGYDLDGDLVQPAQMYAPLLRALGMTSKIPPTVSLQGTMYHQFLAHLAQQGKRVLVLLDNVSRDEQVTDLIPRQQVHRCLITTRDALTFPDGQTVDLDVLEPSEALDLLSQSLARRERNDPRVASDPAGAARVVEACGWLPLAVEISAALLAGERTMPLAELADELDDHATRLEGLQYGQRAVTAAFEGSWRYLRARHPKAARLLRLLPLDPGPDVSTAAAGALAAVPEVQARRLLRSLLQARLLQDAAGRWGMHDLIRLYVYHYVTPGPDSAERGAAIDRLLKFYTNAAETNDGRLRAPIDRTASRRRSERDKALEWFDAQHVNLVGAVSLAANMGRHSRTFRLAGYLNEYLVWRRHLADLLTTSRHALAAAQHLNDRLCEAHAWTDLGVALRLMRAFEEAIVAYQHALETYRGADSRHGEGVALTNLGVVLREVRQFDDAIAAHERALEIFRVAGDLHSEGITCNNLGLALREAQRFDEAIVAHERALEIYREAGNRRGEAGASTNLGLALGEVQRFDEAIAAHERAREIYRDEAGSRHGEGIVWNNLGLVLREMCRFDDAKVAWYEAESAFLEINDVWAVGKVREQLDELPR